jgi:hypothetical protein
MNLLPPDHPEYLVARKLGSRPSWVRPVALTISGATCFGLVLWGLNEFSSLRGIVHILASRVVLAFTVLVAVIGLFIWTRLLRRRGNLWFGLCATVFVGSAIWLDWWAPKPQPSVSALVMRARIVGPYGPKTGSTTVELVIQNPPDEAIQNVDLTVTASSESNRSIRKIEEIDGRNDCKAEPIDIFPQMRVGFKAADGTGGIIMNTDELIRSHIIEYGSPQWKLRCQRLSGQASVKFGVEAMGDAEKDSLRINGNYERIPSKGSLVVPVQNTIAITK